MSVIWQDKSRICGKPITFTTYIIEDDCLYVREGLFNTRENQTLLYKVDDINVEVSLVDKLFNQGTIVLSTKDKSSPTIVLKNILNPYEVRKVLTRAIKEARENYRVRYMETNGDYDISSPAAHTYNDYI